MHFAENFTFMGFQLFRDTLYVTIFSSGHKQVNPAGNH